MKATKSINKSQKISGFKIWIKLWLFQFFNNLPPKYPEVQKNEQARIRRLAQKRRHLKLVK